MSARFLLVLASVSVLSVSVHGQAAAEAATAHAGVGAVTSHSAGVLQGTITAATRNVSARAAATASGNSAPAAVSQPVVTAPVTAHTTTSSSRTTRTVLPRRGSRIRIISGRGTSTTSQATNTAISEDGVTIVMGPKRTTILAARMHLPTR